jgi:methylamine dehydrogenase heavy chain
LTFTLDEKGHVVSQQRSERIFDPDTDPLFVSADTLDDRYVFVSFHGNAYIVNVSGEKAALEALWPIVTAKDKQQGWRPGGYEPLAVQRATHTLFVAMHPHGKEGTHKNPASEIWSFDLRSRQRTARLPGSHAIVLAVSQGPNPMLFAVDGERSGVVAYRIGRDPRPVARLDLGETITDIEVQ